MEAICALALLASCASAPVRIGHVAVTAFDGDLESATTVKLVPAAQFDTDANGRPAGLSGPRVRIELPELVPLSVNERTLEAGRTVRNPLRLPRAAFAGAFRYPARSPAAAMASAFVWATRTIDAMERWARQPIPWGDGGRLTIDPCAFLTDTELCYYDSETRRVCLGATRALALDSARSPDAVIHEGAHAALAALKPGHASGVAAAVHEGLADAASFLVALGEPSVVARVLDVTAGDLRRANELSRFCERPAGGFRRDLDVVVTPADCGLDREEVELLPAFLLNSGGPREVHHVGQVVSGALWDFLVLLYERGAAAGLAQVEAIGSARDAVGGLMLKALTFVGEHDVSLRDYALALVRADAYLSASRCRDELLAVLARRGLVDGPEEVEAELRRRAAKVPAFRLEPGLKGVAAVTRALEDLRGVLRSDLSLYSDVTSGDGLRVLRLSYRRTLGEPADAPEIIDPHLRLNLKPPVTIPGFASLVLDPTGRLVSLWADR